MVTCETNNIHPRTACRFTSYCAEAHEGIIDEYMSSAQAGTEGNRSCSSCQDELKANMGIFTQDFTRGPNYHQSLHFTFCFKDVSFEVLHPLKGFGWSIDNKYYSSIVLKLYSEQLVSHVIN